MGQLLTFRSPRTESEATQKIGMVIFLGSWTLMFGALFFVYGGLRSKSLVWPPLDTPVFSLVWPTLSTLSIILSSVTWARMFRAVRLDRPVIAKRWLFGTVFLGLLFVGQQLHFWRELLLSGLTPQHSSYGSVLFAFIGLHAAHVTIGLVALLYLVAQMLRGTLGPARNLAVRLWGWYWHFVSIVWLGMFVVLFLW